MEQRKLFYAGIGSRQTPPAMLELLGRLSGRLADLGYVLRSGAADGADLACETGCDSVNGKKEIWLPWNGFNGHAPTGFYPVAAHRELAATMHPAWGHLTQGAQSLHARNMGQVLGTDLATPVDFVLCWTPDGCESEATRTRDTGGTGMAIALASRRGIPVFNLAQPGAHDRFCAHLANLRPSHEDGTTPQNGEVFVFGSNLAGRHGKGSALVAVTSYGAQRGQGVGRMSQSYAIPTKDGRPGAAPLADPQATLALTDIAREVRAFIEYAREHADENFFVVRLGCALASHTDGDIAPLFASAPYNCSLPHPWKDMLCQRPGETGSTEAVEIAAPINIWSGAVGIGGALTNMSERAKEKGCIKHSYPVKVNGVNYPDSEAAYQALKVQGADDFNDGLMIDLICLKFVQNPKLMDLTTSKGGVAWLEKCSHFTQAKSPRMQSWEGQGYGSRFICNLVHGYKKALTGRGPVTRVVHAKEAPFDVYIGRRMGLDHPESPWHNPLKVGDHGTRDDVVAGFVEHLQGNPELLAKVESLRGRTLGCWCKSRENLSLSCHGDILAALAEGRAWVPSVAAQGSLF